MKGLRNIIVMAAFWLPIAGFAEETAPDMPQDYAW